jgi:hypothetical protein
MEAECKPEVRGKYELPLVFKKSNCDFESDKCSYLQFLECVGRII